MDCKISPNPTKDFIVVSMPTNMIFEIEIMDILGKTLLKSQVRENNIRLNVSSLQSGVYFAKVSSNDGNTIVKKFVKD